jgi:hypothetical protein
VNVGYESAEDWSHWYFLGFSLATPRKLAFDPKKVEFLLSLVHAERVIAGLEPLDPRHLINDKGVTAWGALFVYAFLNDKESMLDASEGRALLFAPAGFLRESFSSHVNWPEELLARYCLEPSKGHPFILPFIVHQSAPQPQDIQRPLRLPDGSLEIFGVAEFNESEPEGLLWVVQDVAQQIDQEAGTD